MHEAQDHFGLMAQLRNRLTEAAYRDQIEYQYCCMNYFMIAGELRATAIALLGMRHVVTLARGNHLHVDDLVVDEPHRGAGFGVKMIHWTTKFASDRGMVAIYLDSRPEVKDFYRKLSFGLHTSPVMRLIL